MSELIEPLAFIFIASAALLLIASRLPVPAVPLYLLVGIGVSPFIAPGITLELAQLGIAFLVFVFGVAVEPTRFLTVARDSEHVAAVQLVAVGLFAFGSGWLLGLETLSAVYFATAAALSSSLVGRELAESDIRQNLIHGRLTESIHFVQDLFAITIILVLSASAFTLGGVAEQLGYGVLLLALAVVVRVYLFEFLVSLSGDSDELIMLTAIGILITFLALSEAVDVSIAVGAFAAGLAITQDFEDNLSLLSALESIENFFTAIFFVTLGSLVANVPSLEVVVLATVLFVAIVAGKPLVTIATLLREGYDPRTACLTSFSLDQVSEFALVLAISGLLVGQLPQVVFEAIILAAAATMITSTVTYRYEDQLYRSLSRLGLFRPVQGSLQRRSSLPAEPLSDHVIVVGYGKLGSSITAVCQDLDLPVVVVENDPDRFELAREAHETVVFGDAMSDHTWDLVAPERATVILSTGSQPKLSRYLLGLNTDADVILRADRTRDALALLEAGATYVTVPDFLASEQFAETLGTLLDAETSLDALREQNRTALRERVWDARIGGRPELDYAPSSR
ncbi:cation:proton antiporter [Haloferacaceae archaeon DSL9]